MTKETLLDKTKEKLRTILWGLPITGDYFVNKYLKEHCSVELELLKGKRLNSNSHRSIFHFSFNKAATQYVRELLARCAAENDMVTVGWTEYAFHTNFPYLDNLSVAEMQYYYHLFEPTGYLYSVFGGMVEGIPNLKDYLTLLMIRDPRDLLVSEYYSYGYSHSVPSHRGDKYVNFMKMRRKALHSTIDEYVISESERTLNTFQRYLDLLLTHHPQVYITKYEDMTADFPKWLEGLINYCELRVSNALLETLLVESKQLRPKKENVYDHNRKGIPGDYKVKLLPDTIDQLTIRFASVLEKFSYN